MARPEQIRRLQETAKEINFQKALGLEDSPKGRQTRATFEAILRNSSAAELVAARAADPGAPAWH